MMTDDNLSTPKSIPLEVLELCIDAFSLQHGATHDVAFYQTLVSCALSSRALLPRSRYHMYSHIRLSTHPGYSRTDTPQRSRELELLWRTLNIKPSLAGYIRTLELHISNPPLVSPALLLILGTLESHLRALVSSQSDCHSSSNSPCQIRGPGLQELALTGDSSAIVWSNLPEYFLERISQLLSIHLPQLVTDRNGIDNTNANGTIGISCLRLSRLSRVPAVLLSKAKAPLRRVFLQRVLFACAEDDGHTSQETIPENGALSQVEELTTHDCGANLEKALRGEASDAPTLLAGGALRMQFYRLTRLQMCAMQRRDVEWGAAVIEANAGTLQSLEVGGISMGQAQYASMLFLRINLSSLPLLTCLVVTTLAASNSYAPVSPLTLLDMFDFVRPESASRSLKSIKLNVRCMLQNYTPSSFQSILKPEDGGLNESETDNEHPNSQNPESNRWMPALAKSSVFEKFQHFSHISIDITLGLGLLCTQTQGQEAKGRISAQLNGYLTDGVATLGETGVEASLKTEVTLLDNV